MFFYLGLACQLLISTPSLAATWHAATESANNPGGKSVQPTIAKMLLGEAEGQKIFGYTLTNSSGMQVKVINFGGKITDIVTPDKNGKMGW